MLLPEGGSASQSLRFIVTGEIARYLRQLAESEPEIVFDEPLSRGGSTPESEEDVAELRALDSEASGCTKCGLSESRKNVVFGVGNPRARLMFIGEAPGADEDRLGEPFVGRAGKLLDKILTAMKLSRREVYIANILKCRPPGNRNPLPNEAASCMPYLKRQIELIGPDVVVALGLVAAVHLLKFKPNVSVKSLRGRIFNFEGRPTLVTYHPAALLRNPSFKVLLWEDMQMVLSLLSGEIKWQSTEGKIAD